MEGLQETIDELKTKKYGDQFDTIRSAGILRSTKTICVNEDGTFDIHSFTGGWVTSENNSIEATAKYILGDDSDINDWV